MLRIENLTYRIGRRILIEHASAGINPGHRVGLVGRNGAGKTTLLHLITGALDPDEGSIELPINWRVGITRQEAPILVDGQCLQEILLKNVLGRETGQPLGERVEEADRPARQAQDHNHAAR